MEILDKLLDNRLGYLIKLAKKRRRLGLNAISGLHIENNAIIHDIDTRDCEYEQTFCGVIIFTICGELGTKQVVFNANASEEEIISKINIVANELECNGLIQ